MAHEHCCTECAEPYECEDDECDGNDGVCDDCAAEENDTPGYPFVEDDYDEDIDGTKDS